MIKISKKQSERNSEIARLKKVLVEKDNHCFICRKSSVLQYAHGLPKGRFPEHYLEPLNGFLLCPECHVKYDNDVNFRQLQMKMFSQISEFAPRDAKKHFRFNG